jgi:hypothetical protein
MVVLRAERGLGFFEVASEKRDAHETCIGGGAVRLKLFTHPPTHKHATHTLSYWLVRNNPCQQRAPAAGASLRLGKTTQRVHALDVS